MKIVVDIDLCAGHAQCEDVAPEVFGIDDSGKVELLMEEPPEEMRHEVEEAIRLCPVNAISLAD